LDASARDEADRGPEEVRDGFAEFAQAIPDLGALRAVPPVVRRLTAVVAANLQAAARLDPVDPEGADLPALERD
jgi:hypothetical protein